MLRRWVVFGALVLTACSGEQPAGEERDAGDTEGLDGGENAVDSGTYEDAGPPDASVEVDAGEVDAGEVDAGEVDAGVVDAGPRTPGEIFGSKYWDVYRPRFFADFYEQGHVTDRIENGVKAFGDGTIWMGNLLSTMVYEYRAAHLDDSLRVMHEVLDAYVANEQVYGDPVDGYVYRSDRGPDWQYNFWNPAGPYLKELQLNRDNEPSGDQIFGTMRALLDVVRTPEPLVHDGVDLKQRAREHAGRLGAYLQRMKFEMKNPFGQAVKRGPDQRWASWVFVNGFAAATGRPRADFEARWTLSGVPVDPADHREVSRQFVRGCFAFSRSCSAGQAINVGSIPVGVPCNEFNVGLGGDGAVIGLSTDPSSPDWFSAPGTLGWVDHAWLIGEGNALYSMYARYLFGDRAPELDATIRRFLAAPSEPPTGENEDPNGWCVAWRWAKDFDDPRRCLDEKHPLTRYSGLDYMLPRAMASAFGEYPE